MKKETIIISTVFLLGLIFTGVYINKEKEAIVNLPVESFEECFKLGNPIMESYPRKCSVDGETFVEDIGNEIEKADLIRLDNPRPNQVIKSPLEIKGEARGYWFFEASFPIVLTDWDGLIIAEGFATADGEWMTEEFVPFTTFLVFNTPAYGSRGTLILRRDNPSGLPENDDALEIPIQYPIDLGV